MKILNLIFLSTVLMVSAVACGNDEPETPTKPTTPEQPSTPGDGDDDEITLYPWEESRTAMLDYTDMVLFYGGGAQRYIPNWDNNRIESYVTYTNEHGVETWFFDAFLFLEFADYGEGSNMVSFATGYKDPSGKLLSSATKYDWENLINYFFSKGHQLDALDETIGDAVSRLGAPAYKRRVVITIPEPIRNQDSSNASSSTTYWGRVNGVTLDFSRDADRVKACKWYIDRVRQLFDRPISRILNLQGSIGLLRNRPIHQPYYRRLPTISISSNIHSTGSPTIRPMDMHSGVSGALTMPTCNPTTSSTRVCP